MTDTPSRPKSYLVMLNPDRVAPMGADGLKLSTVAEKLNSDIAPLSRGAPRAGAARQAVRALRGRGREPHTLAVDLDDAALDRLKKEFGDALYIEPDHDLDMFHRFTPGGDGPGTGPRNFFAQSGSKLVLEVTVRDEEGRDVALAKVLGRGSALFSEDSAVTNTRGKAELAFFGDTPETLRELRVLPSSDYWGRVIERPDLSDAPVKNGKLQVTVQVTPIKAGLSEADIWGYKAMGLPKADAAHPEPLAPVRIAIIDSGIKASHRDLDPQGGRDFTARGAPDTLWREDSIGHGTHVAGTCGALFDGKGICGAAGPDAALFSLSVFPGGQVSMLIDALDWCIEHEMDIANMSLGSPNRSRALQAACQRAVEAGVFLVAAAGNAAGPVEYPAAFEEVVAVAAIGKEGSFPEDSPHAEARGTHSAGDYFSASFTCFGPQIDAAGPGVAVISCLPTPDDKGYAAWEGTSMAAPYVAGFAARLLRTRAELQAHPAGPARVAALREALLGSCVDLGLPEAYQGRGLPVWRAETDPPGDADGSVIARLEGVSRDLSRALS